MATVKNGEISCASLICSIGAPGVIMEGKKSHSGEIRQETGEQRGAVCYQCRYHQHLSCLLTDIGNGRSDQSENNQWNDETQKFAEDSVESHKYSDQFAGKNVFRILYQCDGDDNSG